MANLKEVVTKRDLMRFYLEDAEGNFIACFHVTKHGDGLEAYCGGSRMNFEKMHNSTSEISIRLPVKRV